MGPFLIPSPLRPPVMYYKNHRDVIGHSSLSTLSRQTWRPIGCALTEISITEMSMLSDISEVGSRMSPTKQPQMINIIDGFLFISATHPSFTWHSIQTACQSYSELISVCKVTFHVINRMARKQISKVIVLSVLKSISSVKSGTLQVPTLSPPYNHFSFRLCTS